MSYLQPAEFMTKMVDARTARFPTGAADQSQVRQAPRHQARDKGTISTHIYFVLRFYVKHVDHE